jgi:peptidyl-prolyl cis-trans isomerase B (cyclophilin B)
MNITNVWSFIVSIKSLKRIIFGLAFVALCNNVVAEETTPNAVIETNLGNIELRFFPDVAPKHVENFLTLAKSGFYDGTIFHRVIPGFMIQGGDPNTKGTDKSKYGQGGPDHQVKAEFNKKSHKRGILSMARSQHPDSAGSQFFIVVKDSPFLDRQYTVFGEVVSGMEVADKIVSQKRDRYDNPLERIEMKVSVVSEAEEKDKEEDS